MCNLYLVSISKHETVEYSLVALFALNTAGTLIKCTETYTEVLVFYVCLLLGRY